MTVGTRQQRGERRSYNEFSSDANRVGVNADTGLSSEIPDYTAAKLKYWLILTVLQFEKKKCHHTLTVLSIWARTIEVMP